MSNFLIRISLVFGLAISSLFLGFLNPSVTNALEPCFSNIPDQNWAKFESPRFGRSSAGFTPSLVIISDPKEVSVLIRNAPKDFVKIQGLEIKSLNGDWQVFPNNKSYAVLLPGDAYRAYVTYEGRSCSKRTIYSTPVEIKVVPSVDIFQYIQNISSNFQQEDKYRQILGDSFPLNLSSEVHLGENEFERALSSSEALKLLVSRRVRMQFDTSCARTVSKGDFASKFMREGGYPVNGIAPKFLKVGKCTAKIYDAAVAEITDYSNLMDLGTITFNVSDPLNTLGPVKPKNIIQCVKGKVTKKITAPKCPAGYKRIN